MTLYLQRLDPDTVVVRDGYQLSGVVNTQHLLLHIGETYEDVPYGVWVLHRGSRVRLSLAQAQAETARSGDLLVTEEAAVTADIPPRVRAGVLCPSCGGELEAARLEIRRPLSAGPGHLFAECRVELPDGTGDHVPIPYGGRAVRWCRRCRTATVDF